MVIFRVFSWHTYQGSCWNSCLMAVRSVRVPITIKTAGLDHDFDFASLCAFRHHIRQLIALARHYWSFLKFRRHYQPINRMLPSEDLFQVEACVICKLRPVVCILGVPHEVMLKRATQVQFMNSKRACCSVIMLLQLSVADISYTQSELLEFVLLLSKTI